jgi:hypothetical protein
MTAQAQAELGGGGQGSSGEGILREEHGITLRAGFEALAAAEKLNGGGGRAVLHGSMVWRTAGRPHGCPTHTSRPAPARARAREPARARARAVRLASPSALPSPSPSPFPFLFPFPFPFLFHSAHSLTAPTVPAGGDDDQRADRPVRVRPAQQPTDLLRGQAAPLAGRAAGERHSNCTIREAPEPEGGDEEGARCEQQTPATRYKRGGGGGGQDTDPVDSLSLAISREQTAVSPAPVSPAH